MRSRDMAVGKPQPKEPEPTFVGRVSLGHQYEKTAFGGWSTLTYLRRTPSRCNQYVQTGPPRSESPNLHT